MSKATSGDRRRRAASTKANAHQNKGETVMAHEASTGTGQPRNKHWLWLLILPWIGVVWVPFYNKVEPVLWGFPFFYWYQLLWVLISAVITAVVYKKTKAFPSKRQGGAR
jgi:hypothetical protein